MARELPPTTAPRAQANNNTPPDDDFGFQTYIPRRPRGLINQFTTVLLQPVYFYRTFPNTRQWVFAALLILAVVGYSAVRDTQSENNASDFPVTEFPVDPSLGGDPGISPGIISGGGGGGGGVIISPGGGFDTGGIPPDIGLPETGGGGTSTSATREITTTALIAAGSILIAWFIQALLLCEVSLFRGKSPQIGRNVQIAVWASIPLALMLAIRLVYAAAGGERGEAMGLTPLLDNWEGYATFSPFLQNVIFSLLSSLTLFWIWNIVLLYAGARHTLSGAGWVAAIVVLQWVIIAVVVPVITGAVTAPILSSGV